MAKLTVPGPVAHVRDDDESKDSVDSESGDSEAAAPSRFVAGNFAPSFEDGERAVRVVAGSVPSDLDGHLVMVGPNPRFSTEGKEYHPFDGDGRLHAVRFSAGAARYSSQWVQTERLLRAAERGFDTFPFGEISAGRFEDMHLSADAEGEMMGPANTAVIAHGRKTYALNETDKPYEISLPDLATVGRETFGGELSHNTAAHPKVDPRTQELMLFGYKVTDDPPHVSYSVVSAAGEVTSACEIPLPCGKLMHDMAITERFSLLFDPNFNFDMEAAMNGDSPWVHDISGPARFGVLPRACSDPAQVRWVDVAPCGLFHFANAWEEPAPSGSASASGGAGATHIVVYGCRSEKMKVDDFDGELPTTVMYEWRIDVGSMTCVSERALSDHVCDFPQVDVSRLGYKTRYLYAVEMEQDLSTVAACNAFPYFKAMLKYDLRTGSVTRHAARSLAGNLSRISEAAFAPSTRRRATHDDDEDLGYVVAYGRDEALGTSECIVLDAKTMQVACRLEISVRVPYGFHATFVPSASPTAISKL